MTSSVTPHSPGEREAHRLRRGLRGGVVHRDANGALALGVREDALKVVGAEEVEAILERPPRDHRHAC